MERYPYLELFVDLKLVGDRGIHSKKVVKVAVLMVGGTYESK